MNYDIHKSPRNNGLAVRIRLELKSGPMGIDAIAEKLGVKRHSVLTCIRDMCVRTGGVQATPDTWPRTYELVPAKPSGVVALPNRGFEFRELRRDPFILRDLAMTTRRA